MSRLLDNAEGPGEAVEGHDNAREALHAWMPGFNEAMAAINGELAEYVNGKIGVGVSVAFGRRHLDGDVEDGLSWLK